MKKILKKELQIDQLKTKLHFFIPFLLTIIAAIEPENSSKPSLEQDKNLLLVCCITHSLSIRLIIASKKRANSNLFLLKRQIKIKKIEKEYSIVLQQPNSKYEAKVFLQLQLKNNLSKKIKC